MNCPICSQDSIVLKTLGTERRRRCTVCHHRFTTTEVLKEEQQRQLEAVQTVIEAAEKLKAAA
jgi:transcriptional regulator NrdR family protein